MALLTAAEAPARAGGFLCLASMPPVSLPPLISKVAMHEGERLAII